MVTDVKSAYFFPTQIYLTRFVICSQQTSAGPLEEILFNQTQTHKQGDEKEKSSKEKEDKDQETGKGTNENPERYREKSGENHETNLHLNLSCFSTAKARSYR